MGGLKTLKLMIVGLGSMGRRRIRLLREHYPEIKLCGTDVSAERRTEAANRFFIPVYQDVGDAIQKEGPNAALVCTSPESHSQIILSCIRQGLHIFSEINLMRDGYEEILAEAEENHVQLFLSSTLLYRREIEYVKKAVKETHQKVNYRYHVGQYLPDWHPWDKGRDFFVWNKKTNGCREIFAIDLPWIINVFGAVETIQVFCDNLSSLKIQYPDNYYVFLLHKNGNKGVFLADVVTRTVVRELLVYSETLHLVWDGTPEGLQQYNIEEKCMKRVESYPEVEKNSDYADTIIENAYLEELRVFMDKITGVRNEENYTFQEDLDTLRLIDRIEGFDQ